jgi:LacI family transcriptional regulator
MIDSRKKRPTQADVAQYANVSQAMVSYVVNQNSAISIPDETRQRILDAMNKLGYVPDITARRLRSRKTLTIASIISDITNPFYPAFERGIQEIADHHHYDLIIYNTDGLKEKEYKYFDSLLQGRVDGVIGVFFHLTAKDLSRLVEQNTYVVRLEASPKHPGTLLIDSVYVDNSEAACAVIDYLVEKGHRDIGMLTSDIGPARYRESGYHAGMREHRLTVNPGWIQSGEFNELGGYSAMRAVLAGGRYPSAVFAANDLMAIGAMAAIREAGLSTPDDIAVIGFDNIQSANLVVPGLTTISQPQRQMGQRAAEMLFERLNGSVTGAGRSERIPYELIVRASA